MTVPGIWGINPMRMLSFSGSDPGRLGRPSPMLLAAELPRAAFEMGLSSAVRPWLAAVPRGDGHPVIVLPGFTASDTATRYLRHFLKGKGYYVHGWRLGTNVGPTGRILRGLESRFAAVSDMHGQKCSIVGWSLGGMFAREIARAQPESVRQVITLGSPFQLAQLAPRNSALVYGALSLCRSPAAVMIKDLRMPRAPLRVPTTAIYSRSDGVVPWQACQDGQGPSHESIEVVGSHCGLVYNPAVLAVIGDRLAQAEDGWAPWTGPLPAGLCARALVGSTT